MMTTLSIQSKLTKVKFIEDNEKDLIYFISFKVNFNTACLSSVGFKGSRLIIVFLKEHFGCDIQVLSSTLRVEVSLTSEISKRADQRTRAV